MISKWVFVCLPLLAALAAPAAARDEPADALSLQALHNFARCAVQRTPDGAEALLAIDPGSELRSKAVSRYAKGHDRCILPGHELKFGGLLLNGALAEALIATRYKNVALADRAAVAPATGRSNLIGLVGTCVARADAAAVAQVLASQPGTAEETAALQRTGQTLQACVPAGQTVKFSKPAVRAIYALGAYDLVRTSSG